jgi:cytidylate kinase
MTVITISRQFGAGGLTLGKIVAEKCGLTFVSDEIIKMVAEKAKVSQNWVRMVEKEAGGKLQKFISSLVPKNLVDRVLDDKRGYIDEEIYLDLLGDIVTQIANEGNCVILGRGGQYILKDHPDVYHVLLIGEKSDRVKFMEEHYNLSNSEAMQVVNAGDKRRTNLYRKFNKTDYDKPDHYHITLNMSRVTMNKAAMTICSLASSRLA